MTAAAPEIFTIRPAREEDCGIILDFIRALARYEKLEDQVVATVEILREQLFRRRHAETLIGLENDRPVAFALFFHNFSTFQGHANLYLEDLFVVPEKRGKGYGRALFTHLAKIARERGCQRLDWWCLDWNEPARSFYRRLGAASLEEWTVHRLEGSALLNLAQEA